MPMYEGVGRFYFAPIPTPNLITGVGHGHSRGWDKEPSNKKRKAQKNTKMKKASRRRNRK